MGKLITFWKQKEMGAKLYSQEIICNENENNQ